MHHFHLLHTDSHAEVVEGIRELVNAVLHGGFLAALRAQSSANMKSLMVSVRTLVGFRLNRPEVQD